MASPCCSLANASGARPKRTNSTIYCRKSGDYGGFV
jgi:hypothetical protein